VALFISVGYSSQILMKRDFFDRFRKNPNFKFCENPTCCAELFCADGHDEINSSFLQFCECYQQERLTFVYMQLLNLDCFEDFICVKESSEVVFV